MKVETCQNCGCTIRNLEQAYVFCERAVCQDCYERLTYAEDKLVQSAIIKKPRKPNLEAIVPQTGQEKSALEQVCAERVVVIEEQKNREGGTSAWWAGWVCLILAIFSGYGAPISAFVFRDDPCLLLLAPFILWTITIGLWIAALILSIIAMARGRILAGVILLVACFVLPWIVGPAALGWVLHYTEALQSPVTDANQLH